MQDQGIVGKLVGGMIRRSVRKTFRNVYWQAPAKPIEGPAVLFANHHGWHDGYLMYHLVKALGLPSVDWIEEFDVFPLFASVGGIRFPKDNAPARAAAIRKTVRLMRDERRSLVLFAEGTLHRGPEILPFGKALPFLIRHLPDVRLVPVAIRYEHGVHERPEAWIRVGDPVPPGPPEDLKKELESVLYRLTSAVRRDESFEILAHGTANVNERWDMRRIPKV